MRFSMVTMNSFDFDNMTDQSIVDLGQLRGQLRINESMKSMFHGGRRCRKVFLYSHDCDDLSRFCRCSQEKYRYI